MSIEIANESGADVDEAALAALARHVLDGMRVHPLAELSVLLVDEPAMTELHVRWMGESGPTDVLAFPMDELWLPQPGGTRSEHAAASEPASAPVLLGDVVICPQVAGEQARQAAHDVRDEIDLLCTHGILHLLGYDHADPDEHAKMFGLQDRLLASWRSERDPGSGPARTAGAATDISDLLDAPGHVGPGHRDGPDGSSPPERGQARRTPRDGSTHTASDRGAPCDGGPRGAGPDRPEGPG